MLFEESARSSTVPLSTIALVVATAATASLVRVEQSNSSGIVQGSVELANVVGRREGGLITDLSTGRDVGVILVIEQLGAVGRVLAHDR